jgi:peptidoglycan/LPS O-acetylase OafA/YrhL
VLSPILLLMNAVAPRGRFEAGLCPQHFNVQRRSRPRLRLLLYPLVGFLVGVVLASCDPRLEKLGFLVASISAGLLPFMLIFCFSPRPLLKAVHSDRRYLWVDKVSPEYLRQLPEIGGESSAAGD